MLIWVNPLIIGVITHLLSGMSHQASLSFGISISWDLLLTLRQEPRPILLVRLLSLLLTYLFLYPFVLTACYFETSKELPSTTLYYKACTKYFPALLRTTELAQSTSQALLRTTKFAQSQSTSQYCFALQSLRKVLPSTTLEYTIQSFYWKAVFTQRSFHTKKFFLPEYVTQNRFFTPRPDPGAKAKKKHDFEALVQKEVWNTTLWWTNIAMENGHL